MGIRFYNLNGFFVKKLAHGVNFLSANNMFFAVSACLPEAETASGPEFIRLFRANCLMEPEIRQVLIVFESSLANIPPLSSFANVRGRKRRRMLRRE